LKVTPPTAFFWHSTALSSRLIPSCLYPILSYRPLFSAFLSYSMSPALPFPPSDVLSLSPFLTFPAPLSSLTLSLQATIFPAVLLRLYPFFSHPPPATPTQSLFLRKIFFLSLSLVLSMILSLFFSFPLFSVVIILFLPPLLFPLPSPYPFSPPLPHVLPFSVSPLSSLSFSSSLSPHFYPSLSSTPPPLLTLPIFLFP